MKTLLLLLAPLTAFAQASELFYTGALMTDITTVGYPAPTSGQLTGYLWLDAPLAANLKDVTVAPLSFVFQNGGGGQLSTGYIGNPGAFAFSTNVAGLITDWSMSFTDNAGGNRPFTTLMTSTEQLGDSSQWDGSRCSQNQNMPCSVSMHTSSPGAWYADSAGLVRLSVAAPEIDPSSAASGLTLLFGALALLRSKRNSAIDGSGSNSGQTGKWKNK
jgi:hypothetical protein